MVDASEYFDNDIVHLSRSILGEKYKKRSSILSRSQLKIIVVSKLTEEALKHPEKFKTFGDMVSYVSDVLLDFSTSLEGRGLETIGSAVNNRLAVHDMQKQKGSDKVDMDER